MKSQIPRFLYLALEKKEVFRSVVMYLYSSAEYPLPMSRTGRGEEHIGDVVANEIRLMHTTSHIYQYSAIIVSRRALIPKIFSHVSTDTLSECTTWWHLGSS